MAVEVITSRERYDELISSGKLIFVDFTAPWCRPCTLIAPTFEALAKENNNEGIWFCKIDVEEQHEIAQEVGVKAMPTFMVFKNGTKVGELVGADKKGLEELVCTALA